MDFWVKYCIIYIVNKWNFLTKGIKTKNLKNLNTFEIVEIQKMFSLYNKRKFDKEGSEGKYSLKTEVIMTFF